MSLRPKVVRLVQVKELVKAQINCRVKEGGQTGAGQGAGEGSDQVSNQGSNQGTEQGSTSDTSSSQQSTADGTTTDGTTTDGTTTDTTTDGDTTTQQGAATDSSTDEAGKDTTDSSDTSDCTRKRAPCSGVNAPTDPSPPGPARIDRPLDYGQAQANGNAVLNSITTFINGNLPKKIFPSPDLGYVFRKDGVDVTGESSGASTPSETDPRRLGHPNIFADPENLDPDLNLDIEAEVQDLAWVSPKVRDPMNDVVNGAKINTDGGVIIQSVRSKDADANVLPDGTATNAILPSHELSWQLWQRQVTADGGDLSNLKVLVAESVQGLGTQQTIKTAVGRLNLPSLSLHHH